MRSAVARGLHAGLVLPLLAALACGEPGPPTYEGRGAVREVDAKERQVVIAHEDIPGLMPAMTMNFDVPDPKLLAALAPGQQIRFRVAFDGRSYRIVDADVIGSLEAGESSSSSPMLAGAVAERDVAPAFALTDQDGRPLALADLRGKTILLDFIFTHCTGPCPILTGLQVDVQRALTPEQRAKTHFVSISLDPERDTPEVLRAYAKARGADLADWSFLTGPPDVIDAVLRSYGVGIVRKAGEEPAHLVASFVIDGEGRIAHRIIGLEQPAAERARLLVSTAGGAS
jgi:protein SCO1/2